MSAAILESIEFDAFPYFSGYEDEVGSGSGLGFTYNLPMPEGTEFGAWQSALNSALRRIAEFRAVAGSGEAGGEEWLHPDHGERPARAGEGVHGGG